MTVPTGQAADRSRLSSDDVDAVADLVDEYRLAPTPEGRAAAVSGATRFARESERAFQLGLEALDDRSKRVRYRACGLLAYSLRKDAVLRLRSLLHHDDRDTRDDARAALAAICDQNHHLFMDRGRSDLVFWIVDARDIPHP